MTRLRADGAAEGKALLHAALAWAFGALRRQRQFERDLARHNARLYTVHIGAATRPAGRHLFGKRGR